MYTKARKVIKMKLIGNFFWFILGGVVLGLAWAITGLLWCVTIVGIPVGVQCFKFAKLAFFPFGKDIVYGTTFGSLLLNILWLIFGGFELALTAAAIGLIYCVTIVGIPFGIQAFKFARLALFPFGAKVR